VASSPAGRVLGFWSLWALGLNGIVGVGIFYVPARVAELVPGVQGSLVYALTALCLLPVAATYALLGGRFAEDGGPFVWARAAFGQMAGFAVGWVAYISALFSTAAVLSSLGEQLASELGLKFPLAAHGAAWFLTAVLGLIVLAGLRPSALVWNALTVSKLVPLLALVGFALWFWVARSVPAVAPDPGPRNLWRAVLIVVFATQGFEIVVVPAGQVRRPHFTVPLATVGSLVAAGLLYVAVHGAAIRAVPGLALSRTPLVAAARAYGGPLLGQLVSLGTALSALGIAFGMMAMTPRYLSPLGHAEALGRWLGDLDAHAVPRRALGVTSALVLALIAASDLGELFVLASVAVLAQYAVSAASLVALAWRHERGLGWRHAWPAPLGLLAIWLLGRAASLRETAVMAVVLVLGVLLLWLRRRYGARAGE
jgi:basic amino acid/polyamine antiporter, APA family